LKNIKDTEINTLEQIKQDIKEKEEYIHVKKNKTDNILNKFKNKKDYYNKIKNKFKIDKDIYFKLKEEITNGDRNINILP
jgi:septal ring factor EnvC (AmiA/AmiB activator)